ncbi:hypothetical protein GCM10009682_43000 [Luedemannella flava]|uniref:Tetratricopeptide repeat protein n=1 Tax=Luedemannella flava TaxID=349316 RepID=A0ABP4YHY3_9ACTN
MPADPRLVHARNFAEIGRNADAERLLREVLAARPADAHTLALLSYVLRQLGRYREARRVADEAIAIAPDDPEPHLQRGEALLELGRFRHALDSAREAVRLAPQRPREQLLLARALSDRDQHDEARRVAESAIALDPRHAQGHFVLAGVEWNARRLAEAERAARRGLELSPTNAQGRWLLAMIDAKRWRVRRSVRALTEVAGEQPTERPGYLLWPLEAGAFGLRWWLAPAALLVLIATNVGMPSVLVGARIGGTVIVLAATAMVLRIFAAAGPAPWHALRTVSRWRRRAIVSGLACTGLTVVCLATFAAVAPRWPVVTLAVVAAAGLWPAKLVDYWGRLDDEPEIRAAFGADLRDWVAELRRWWRQTRASLRDAWHDTDTTPRDDQVTRAPGAGVEQHNGPA